MTTFWLTFNDCEAPSNERFLGVAIFDMDEDANNPLSADEIVREAWRRQINPGGTVCICEVEAIPNEHKNKLITDDALLLRLGSKGRKGLS